MDELDQNKRASIIWRGRVLDAISTFEFMMNHYIAEYFCDDREKSKEMVVVLLGDDRVSLGAKAQVFCAISQNKHSKWYNSYKSIRIPEKGKKQYSMNSDIVWAIEQRNIFAHRMVTYDMEISTEEKISTQFVQYKNQENYFIYYNDDLERLINVINNLKSMFDMEKY